MKKIIVIIGFLGAFASNMVTASAAYFNSAPVARCETQITKLVRKGSENNDVYLLQNLLVNAGFLHTTPNGYFGNQTREALKAFQYANFLSVTGVLDESTRNAVNERLCDTDLLDTVSYTDGNYQYAVGTTFVSPNDPFVKVVVPQQSSSLVYATPQSRTLGNSPLFSDSNVVSVPVITMNNPSSQIVATGIVYNPQMGYTYGVIPQSGSITVSSPLANNSYQEGDTVFVSWGTSNIQASAFTISLESSISGQNKVVAITSDTSYSFVLTKELLDSVCSGTCNNNQQGSFKVIVSTPTTDIAGITSTLRAAISPITIRRPLTTGTVSITPSKTPVNSGEIFKLYINIPTGASWNSLPSGSYSVKVKALCTSGVSVTIAGTPCGQEFVIPFAPTAFQQEIPATINNQTWYKQDVTFDLTVVNLLGQTIGKAETKVVANGASFSW